ncbi:MAG: ABC transporter permease [Patescibacteria group bacterium]|nr:ABC transporter permease [Patescibacteria group bacterium]
MKNVFTIWKKELKDNIRDRRTLMSTIILPMVLMPGIIVGMGKFTMAQIKNAQEQAVIIGVVNEAVAQDFVTILRQLPKVEVKALAGDFQAEVKNKKVDAAVVFPDNFQSAIKAEEPVVAEVYRNSLNSKSSTALARLTTAVTQYNQLILQGRLGSKNITPEIQNGLSLQAKEVATEQELGGFGLSYLLPLFIIMWAVIGGQNAAVDTSAGEKERKTLEALILTPVSRLQIVFGKFLAVATAALTSEIVALGSMYAVFAFGGADFFTAATSSQASGVIQSNTSSINFSLEPQAVAIMFGVSILLVMLFSALNLSVAIFAKSYKEAQSYIGPSYLVVILPVVLVNMLPSFQATLGFFAIPIVNTVLLFKEVLIGVYNTSHILLTVGMMIVTALVTMYIASRIYQKEGVLFKE